MRKHEHKNEQDQPLLPFCLDITPSTRHDKILKAVEFCKKTSDNLAIERMLLNENVYPVAGVDEVGRGPLAGPVTAAALILPRDWIIHGLPKELSGLTDSKRLSPAKRNKIFEELSSNPEVIFAIDFVDAHTIDRLNILNATLLAMQTAVNHLKKRPVHVIIDGNVAPDLDMPATPIVKGDLYSATISAASIIAKVARDKLMQRMDLKYPGYGFAKHKGYGTAQHIKAIRKMGVCEIHRKTFLQGILSKFAGPGAFYEGFLGKD
jgi:ribonuclease HII